MRFNASITAMNNVEATHKEMTEPSDRTVSVRCVDRHQVNPHDGATDSTERRYGKEIEVSNTK